MTDIQTILRSLARPRLLVEAAQHGTAHYRRETHLRRHLAMPALPSPRQAAMRLICLEQTHEEARRAGAAEYSPLRHVDVLIALMGEAAAIAADAGQEKASAASNFLRAV